MCDVKMGERAITLTSGLGGSTASTWRTTRLKRRVRHQDTRTAVHPSIEIRRFAKSRMHFIKPIRTVGRITSRTPGETKACVIMHRSFSIDDDDVEEEEESSVAAIY